jgi:hypothetical protein
VCLVAGLTRQLGQGVAEPQRNQLVAGVGVDAQVVVFRLDG